jgi:integrase/recombinase XerD
MLETFYATGIRRGELVGLDVSDLEMSLGQLHIRKGKGGKGRLVPVGQQSLAWLEKYLETSRPLLVFRSEEPALFLSGYGDRLSSGHLGNWVSRTLKAAGIQRAGACHLFRHACATHMLENGADIRFIQELLGHARLDTTQIYTKVSIQALHAVYRRCHPAAQPSP